MNEENKISWFTETRYIDIDTQKPITKEQVKYDGYRVIKKTKKTSINETTGIVSITNECRKTLQLF